MTQKNIIDFIKTIRENDFEKIKKMVADDKAYVTVCNGKTPKRDAGQSALQIALKTGSFDIAQFLIEQGADVNFIEDQTIATVFCPVLHDCIKMVFLYSLDKEMYYDKALNILKMMISKGANPETVDCAGNNALNRAILDTAFMRKYPDYDKMEKIAVERFREIFKILIDAGADINETNNKRDNAINNIKKFGLENYKLL